MGLFSFNCNSSILLASKYFIVTLTLFDMAFFEPSGFFLGGRHKGPHHNFVVILPMIMKFGTSVKRDVFYIMVTKN